MGCCFSNHEDVTIQNQELPKGTVPDLAFSRAVFESQPQPLKNAEIYKLEGNNHYKNKNYIAAIVSYQNALRLSKKEIIYYTNLALAYQKNHQYQQSVDVINSMLEQQLGRNFQNAELIRKGKITKARSLVILTKDYCLSGKYDQHRNRQMQKRVQQAIEILEQSLSGPNTNKQFQGFLENGLKVKQFLQVKVLVASKSDSLLQYFQNRLNQPQYNESAKYESVKKYFQTNQSILNELSKFIQKKKTAVVDQDPDYIMDPITYEMFKNPVIVPSGNSYEEETLKTHFANNGYKDPITHQIFQQGEKVLVRNHNLSDYVHEIKKVISKEDLQYLIF